MTFYNYFLRPDPSIISVMTFLFILSSKCYGSAIVMNMQFLQTRPPAVPSRARAMRARCSHLGWWSPTPRLCTAPRLSANLQKPPPPQKSRLLEARMPTLSAASKQQPRLQFILYTHRAHLLKRKCLRKTRHLHLLRLVVQSLRLMNTFGQCHPLQTLPYNK